MAGKKIGLIRVLTTDDSDLLQAHGAIIEKNIPELKVESRCIPDQPTGVHSEETHRKAVPKILELAKEMEKEGLQGIIISCAGDPGLEESRAVLKIPVLGAGKTLALTALICGDKVGVLSLSGETPVNMKNILGDALVAEESAGAENAVELMEAGKMERVLASCQRLKNRGAEVIVPACTGMSTIGAAQKIIDELNIKVIDPVVSEGIAMWSILKFYT